MAGKCKYTGEVRAVKSAPSYEIFTMLQKLNDIRYVKFTSEDKIEKKKLSKEVIHKLYD
ncbi:Uncharacterized protein conserved in bacteria [Streptobacillus moniliformis]|nr:Uncharacterized protein conserved in bacteria [Streptobacillus moniliformis]